MTRLMLLLVCALFLSVAPGVCAPGAFAPNAFAQDAPRPGYLISSGEYLDMDWRPRLEVIKEVLAALHRNKCAVALRPEDLARIVNSDLTLNWKEGSADVNMGQWICRLLQMDYAICMAEE